MHKSTEIRHLFIKFINGECSPEEVHQVLDYVKNSKNRSGFPSVEDIYEKLAEYPEMDDAQADIMFKNIVSTATPSKRKSYLWKYAMASLVVLGLASTYFLKSKTPPAISVPAPVTVSNNVQTGTDKALLTLENGENIELEKDSDYKTDNLISDGDKLVYKSQNTTNVDLAFNYLTVPRGGQYQLQLADGTKVWLNSETKLKYPVAFIAKQPREVELLYGEAYFEVSPSTSHDGSRFVVKTQTQAVEVLGTSFNIKAYKGDHTIYTTLVEGKVALSGTDSVQHLHPNQQAVLDLNHKTLHIQNVEVYNEISWKNGLFSFKGKSLKEIMIVLARWYDVDFEFSDKQHEVIKFNGVLLKRQSLDEVLTIIKETKFINSYEIKDRKIIIN